MTAKRRTAILCADCRTFHGEKRPATPLCSCSVIDPRQDSCSCEATVIRAAAGVRGWGVIPPDDDAVVELSQARCDACRRTLPPGPRWRTTIFDLDPTPEPISPSDAWLRAATPASRAAALVPVKR